MNLTLLQIIIIISGIIFLIFAIDFYQRKRFNALHFLVFFGGTAMILLFASNGDLLNRFGNFFGLSRGADLLVYISIILLAYFYFEILNRVTKHSLLTTRIITEQAIQKALSHNELDNLKLIKSKFEDYVFLVRSYNEAKTLPKVIDEIVDKGFSKILIINDGSSDGTIGEVLKKKAQYSDKKIILLSHLINRGAGSANKTGFEFLRRYSNELNVKRIVTYDADGQMNIDDMDSFFKSIVSNKDSQVFLGSRFVTGGSVDNIPFMRRIILFGSKIITYLFNGLWVTDPHSGYRVISANALSKIRISSDNMTYASELLDEIQRLQLKFVEVPINIKYTEYSLSKGQKNSNAFKILFELIYKRFFYK